MYLKELLSRRSPSHYSIDECVYIVERYIFQEKGVNVTINIYKHMDKNNINNPMARFMLSNQLNMLNEAFSVAHLKLKR